MPQDHPDKVVRLSINAAGMAVPDQDPVQIRKGNQKVRWAADFPFTIEIDGYADLQHSNGGGTHTCKSGYFADAKPYKYSIIANGNTNDPTLDVQP